MYDVARLAGVSTATVSRVLGSSNNVRDETRLRVLEAVRQLNYQPSHLARNLRKRTARIIGLIIGDVGNPYFSPIVRGCEEVARQFGLSLVLANTDEDPERESAAIRTMAGERASGVVLVSAGAPSIAIRGLTAAGVALVALDRRVTGVEVDTVVTDNERASFAATTHLMDLGHRRIGLIGGPQYISPVSERLAGYQRALSGRGVQADPGLVRLGSFREGTAYTLASEILDLPDPPTAIFALSNSISIGVLRVLRDRGLTIPGDISVLGFDDLPAGDLITPTLTVVSQPLHDMGATATELLLKRIADSDGPVREVVLSSTLVIGQSTGPMIATETPARGI